IVQEVPSSYMVKKFIPMSWVKVEIFCNAKNTTLTHDIGMIKNHHVSGGTIVFLGEKWGVFWGLSPCIYTLGITSGYFFIDFFMLNLDISRL
ncbi:hypothetical protein, partial [Moraxella sp. Pampa]